MTDSSRRILVIVGTDHHAFDRIVRWADDHQRDHVTDKVFVQYGFSREPQLPHKAQFLSPAELRVQAELADVVITHGGPGTIGDARSAGHMPIVVPREPGRAEHVDDHQVRFSAWAESRGLVRREVDTAELDRVIEGLGAAGTRHQFTGGVDVEGSVQAVRDVVAVNRGRSGAVHPPGSPLVMHITGPNGVGTSLSTLAFDPEVAFLGRVGVLWDHGAHVICTCGAGVESCEFWGEVGRRAYGGWGAVVPDRGRPVRNGIEGSIPPKQAARRHPGATARAQLLAFAEQRGRLYTAVLEVTRAAAVIETADHIGAALALSHDRRLDVRVLQVQGEGQPRGILTINAFRLKRRLIPNSVLPSRLAQPAVVRSRVDELLGLRTARDLSGARLREPSSQSHILVHPKEPRV